MVSDMLIYQKADAGGFKSPAAPLKPPHPVNSPAPQLDLSAFIKTQTIYDEKLSQPASLTSRKLRYYHQHGIFAKPAPRASLSELTSHDSNEANLYHLAKSALGKIEQLLQFPLINTGPYQTLLGNFAIILADHETQAAFVPYVMNQLVREVKQNSDIYANDVINQAIFKIVNKSLRQVSCPSLDRQYAKFCHDAVVSSLERESGHLQQQIDIHSKTISQQHRQQQQKSSSCLILDDKIRQEEKQLTKLAQIQQHFTKIIDRTKFIQVNTDAINRFFGKVRQFFSMPAKEKVKLDFYLSQIEQNPLRHKIKPTLDPETKKMLLQQQQFVKAKQRCQPEFSWLDMVKASDEKQREALDKEFIRFQETGRVKFFEHNAKKPNPQADLSIANRAEAKLRV